MNSIRIAWLALLGAFVLAAATPAFAAGRETPAPADLTGRDLVAVEELAKALARPAGQRPLLLYVGFRRLYGGGHIPGSRYAGPGSTPAGLAALRGATGDVPRDREIVLYCGCCPWKDCPNIRPAVRELRRLGFKKVRALSIPTDFFTDWADKGHPVKKGD